MVRIIAVSAFLFCCLGAQKSQVPVPPAKVHSKMVDPHRFNKPPTPNNNVMVFLTFTTATTNIVNNFAVIDDPNLNGRPDLVVIATQRWQSPPGVYNPHPVGVWYTNGKWSIFNEDRASMPDGAMFDVLASRPGIVAGTGDPSTQGNPGVAYRLAGINSLEDLWLAVDSLNARVDSLARAH